MAWAVLVLLTGCAGSGGAAPPRVEIVQTVTGLNNPESVAFSPDGRWLFVTNCASGEFGSDKHIGMVAGEASISKLSVAPDGRLAMVTPRFIEGLSGTLGISVAPEAFGPYPKGSLFVCVGLALLSDEHGAYVTDARKLGTGVAVFDPDSGMALGKVDLGVGSSVAVALGHPLLLPNGVAFDGEGGLLVTDTGLGGDHLQPRIASRPGVLRLTVGPKGEVTGHTFTPVSGGPNGITWNAKEKAVYWVTCNGQGPEGGAVYRNGKPLALSVGPCDGIVVTPAGTIIASRFRGDLIAIRQGGNPATIPFEVTFGFPSDIKLWTRADGSSILVVPEQEAWNPVPWTQSLRVVLLPADY